MGKRWYLAGPMTGIPQGNFPLFDAATKWLRAQGHDIVSPAELDDAATRAAVFANEPTGHTWGDFLARDVKLIADECQGVILLPFWEKSRGARLEAYVALMAGLEFQVLGTYDDADGKLVGFNLMKGDAGAVRDAIYASLGGNAQSELGEFRAWLDRRWANGGWGGDPAKNITIQALGLAGETGEVVEHFKKHIRDGAPLHTHELLLEFGDVLHYWCLLVQAAGFTPAEVMRANVQKLELRDARKRAAVAALNAAIDEVTA